MARALPPRQKSRRAPQTKGKTAPPIVSRRSAGPSPSKRGGTTGSGLGVPRQSHRPQTNEFPFGGQDRGINECRTQDPEQPNDAGMGAVERAGGFRSVRY